MIKPLLALGMLLAGVARAGTVTYVYTDPQGTPLAEANASGTITATFDYAPYGSQALGTPPNGPGYTGHVNDPDTGLVYMQARYYDPAVGRFISTDPVGPGAGDLFTFNRFDYVSNNPVMGVDPTGRAICGPEGSAGCQEKKQTDANLNKQDASLLQCGGSLCEGHEGAGHHFADHVNRRIALRSRSSQAVRLTP